MNAMRPLRGIELRYVLAMHLAHHGPATVAELVEALSAQGFTIAGRPSKSVSDALRWEMVRGGVRRLRRGRYGPSFMPRATEHRIHKRVLVLREEARMAALTVQQLVEHDGELLGVNWGKGGA